MTVQSVSQEPKPARRGPSEVHRRQRTKNIVVARVLVAVVALFYVLSIVRMGPTMGSGG